MLPQSLQLSVFNAMALDAQKASVRALYQYARGEAYAVGEYQTERLGNPKLIILPSPLALDSAAWEDILAKVRNGSVLLVTGPFDRDAHFHPAGRREEIALPYEDAMLTTRESMLQWPEGEARLPSAETGPLTSTAPFFPATPPGRKNPSAKAKSCWRRFRWN